jgi:hypothetical protein
MRARPFTSWEQPRAPVESKLNNQRRLRKLDLELELELEREGRPIWATSSRTPLDVERPSCVAYNASEDPAVQG